ncbi:hypothetical protein OFC21_23030, partial [Escherichia coli]|nr:hypothetical protein [Escherichia coli]
MSSPVILQGGYVLPLSRSFTQLLLGIVAQKPPHRHPITGLTRHCCKVSDEAAFCLIQRPYISKTLLT